MKQKLPKHSFFLLFCASCFLWLTAHTQDLALGGYFPDESIGRGDQETSLSLKTALDNLENKHRVRFNYASDLVLGKRVTLSQKELGTDLEKGLQLLLSPIGLRFERISENVYGIYKIKPDSIVKPLEPANNDVGGRKNGQSLNEVQDLSKWSDRKLIDRDITGTVKDVSNDEPLPGVNILVKGTSIGTVTDVNGKYTLSVPDDATTLVFSSVGYTAEEVTIGGRTVIDLLMSPDVQSLSEVVVIGYGTQEKKDVTGAISSVSAQDIMEVPVMNAQQALQGRAPGVDVVALGNRPGQDVQVRVRGRRSFVAGNNPLFVVDGIPFSGTINDINPADIESMEILKDASATAIYGSRGANGVVLITTKRGRQGKTNISYNGYFGPVEAYGKVDMMNGEEFAEYKRESRRTTGQYPSDVTDPNLDAILFEQVELESIADGYAWNDYQELILQSGHQQSHQLSVDGGGEKTTFNVSFNYFNERGITKTQDFDRFTVRVNLDHKISERLKVGTSTLLTHSIQNWGPNPWGEALANNPLGRPFNDDGTLRFRPTTDGLRVNPLADVTDGAFIDERRRYRIFSSLYANYKITDDLNFQVNFGPDAQIRRRGLFQGRFTSARAEGAPRSRVENQTTFNYTLENILQWNKTFGDHSLNVTGLFSIQEERFEESFTDVLDQPFESAKFYNLGSAPLVRELGSELREWAILSWMGRVQYGLFDKYLFTATVRADGSSRLAEDNKWGVFPSAAFAWRLIDEGFMDNQSIFQDLKLRVSYGQVGNTAGLRPNISQGRLARTMYAFGEDAAIGFRPDLIPNENLQWESTTTFNAGVDFSVLNGRISGAFEYYIADTEDLIMNRQLPTTSGFDFIQENVGSTRNTGFEIQLSSVNIDNPGGFKWTTDVVFNRNREEIVELFGGKDDDIGNQWFIGEPMTTYFDYEKIGIWQLDEVDEAQGFSQQPGEIKVRDQDGNGRIDGDDRIILGSDQPDWGGSITNRFEYKGFDLSVFVFARWGQMVRSRFHDNNNTLFGRYNNLDVDYWTPTNPTNANPRPNEDQERPVWGSTLSYKDGSFLKIRSISMGYNVPEKFMERLPLSSLRIYATAQQPLIWARDDDLRNLDPEITRTPETRRDRADFGAERQAELSADVPGLRVFVFGINATF